MKPAAHYWTELGLDPTKTYTRDEAAATALPAIAASHPDHGGTTASFQRARTAWKLIEAYLKP